MDKKYNKENYKITEKLIKKNSKLKLVYGVFIHVYKKLYIKTYEEWL